MTFKTLTAEELADVADFFVVDVENPNPEKPLTKKVLLAALSEGEQPVTWEDYETIYLVAKEREAAAKATPAPEVAPPEQVVEVVPTAPVVVDKSDWILVKMDRQNFRYDIRGYSFTKKHPFQALAPQDAEYVISNVEGFRQALPSEVQDYYN
jgi:hypothetical protein